jgi:hypothetical protein
MRICRYLLLIEARSASHLNSIFDQLFKSFFFFSKSRFSIKLTNISKCDISKNKLCLYFYLYVHYNRRLKTLKEIYLLMQNKEKVFFCYKKIEKKIESVFIEDFITKKPSVLISTVRKEKQPLKKI